MFSYRTRMALYSNNFKGSSGVSTCPLCQLHLDIQSLCFQCPKIRENVKIVGKYENIFSIKFPISLAKTILEISHYRKRFLDERQLDNS